MKRSERGARNVSLLVERGACRFDHKIVRAQAMGATGVIVYDSAAGGEGLILTGGNNPAIMPGGSSAAVTVPPD